VKYKRSKYEPCEVEIILRNAMSRGLAEIYKILKETYRHYIQIKFPNLNT